MRRSVARLGFAGLRGLERPSDWAAAATRALREVDACRGSLATTRDPLVVLRLVDAMSNALCGVLDGAELCRSAHAAPEWREAAHGAFVEVAGAMEVAGTV